MYVLFVEGIHFWLFLVTFTPPYCQRPDFCELTHHTALTYVLCFCDSLAMRRNVERLPYVRPYAYNY